MMVAQIEIEVMNQTEAEAIQRALEQPDVLAYVKIVGLLLPMGQRARERILRYAVDVVGEQQQEASNT
ncbi:MAG: hypothetical protein V7638_3905 [Acidobacteriota bacterium]|jgi:hypothetical protein